MNIKVNQNVHFSVDAASSNEQSTTTADAGAPLPRNVSGPMLDSLGPRKKKSSTTSPARDVSLDLGRTQFRVTPGMVAGSEKDRQPDGLPYDQMKYVPREGGELDFARSQMLIGIKKGPAFEVYDRAQPYQPAAELSLVRAGDSHVVTEKLHLKGGAPGKSNSSGNGSSSSTRRSSRAVAYISDSELRAAAQRMYDELSGSEDQESLEDYLDILTQMITFPKEPGTQTLPHDNVAISSNGRITGLMSVGVDMKNKEGTTTDDWRSTFWIDKIVVDPQTRGNGTALLAKAIAMSEENGFGGIVRTFVQMSHEFYEARGFHEVDGQIQELDPNASPNWRKRSNGEWQFSE